MSMLRIAWTALLLTREAMDVTGITLTIALVSSGIHLNSRPRSSVVLVRILINGLKVAKTKMAKT